jgi:hypothetical protein
LALSLACGVDVFNFTATGNRHVLYIDAEATGESAAQKIKQLVAAYDCKQEDADRYFHLWSKIDHSIPSLMGEEGRNTIESKIKDFSAKLIVFDNLLTLVPEIVQAPAKWTSLSSWFKELSKNYKTAVLFIHHTGKDGSSLGLQQIASTTNNIFKISEVANHNLRNPGCAMVFEVQKNKVYPSLDKFKKKYFLEAPIAGQEARIPWIKIEDERSGYSTGTTSTGYIDDDSLSRDENKIMKLISEKGEIKREDIYVLLNCKEGTSRNRLKKLIENKLIGTIGAAQSTRYILRKQDTDTQDDQP